jgi:hypothetical protein
VRPPDVSALVKLGLGILWLGVARVAGAPNAGALLGFGGGAFVTVFALFNDPRTALLRPHAASPAPEAGFLRQVLGGLMPSTVGVSALAVAAIAWQPELTAVLGGICAGLGAAGLLYAVYRRV